MPSNDVIALAKRINDEFGIAVNPNRFYRTYVGYWQRAAGACTWVIYADAPATTLVGGFEPVRKYITKRNRLDISRRGVCGYELYVYAPNEVGYDRLEKDKSVCNDGIVTLCFDEED